MLVHFQEEVVFGGAHGVDGDETIITIPSFIFIFYSLLWGLPWLGGLRCILTFFCNFV